MNKNEMRQNESGNVLFLILIAVALFAALSYAVTQSSRSGGGDTNNETNLVNSASLTQYPASVRTSILRMMVSNGAVDEELQFDYPVDFGDDCTANSANCVFHPDGGGATYAEAPADVMADGQPGQWFFNRLFEIVNVGTNGSGGNDVIAFLPGITRGICERINEEMGLDIASIDVTNDFTDASYADNIADADVDGNGVSMEDIDGEDIGDTDAADLAGQPFGCMIDSSTTPNTFIYYHVLIEK
ncbi:MAG: hypothetical protein KTR28_02945 [Micavibrio sp.]|nr:hypothetical protein [Micavibrio sp.]